MSDISSIGHRSIGPIERAARMLSAHGTTSKATTNGHGQAGDRVEVSPHAQLMQRLRELPAVRQDLIDRVRREIAIGAYDAPEVLDAAVDRLMDDMG